MLELERISFAPESFSCIKFSQLTRLTCFLTDYTGDLDLLELLQFLPALKVALTPKSPCLVKLHGLRWFTEYLFPSCGASILQVVKDFIV